MWMFQKKSKNLTLDKNVEEDKTTEDNNEISINYVMTEKRWNRTNVVVDNIFAYNVVLDIISKNKDYEPKLVEECQQINIGYCGKKQLR